MTTAPHPPDADTAARNLKSCIAGMSTDKPLNVLGDLIVGAVDLAVVLDGRDAVVAERDLLAAENGDLRERLDRAEHYRDHYGTRLGRTAIERDALEAQVERARHYLSSGQVLGGDGRAELLEILGGER